MTRGNLSLAIPLVAILVLGLGLANAENAYANGEEDHGAVIEVHCETEFDWELSYSEGEREGEGECLIIFEDEYELEVDADVYGEFGIDLDFPDADIEGYFVIEIDDEGFEGTLYIDEDGFIEDLPYYDIETTGFVDESSGDFGDLSGCEVETHGEGSIEEFDYPDFEGEGYREVWIFCEIEDHGDIVELHCDTYFDWAVAYGEGEREGYGECIAIFVDDHEIDFEVYIGGSFDIDLDFPDADIEGYFTIDFEGGYLEILEDGTIIGLPEYDSETTGFVGEAEGIFAPLSGCEVETHGGGELFGFEYPYFFGEGFREIWIVCEIEGSEEVEDESNGSGCDNCQPPTLGLNKEGDYRYVEGGFDCNNQSVDVDHYYTEFPTITNAVGQPLTCFFTIYEDTGADNIRHFEFAVGKRVGDSMSEEQGKITWDRNHLLQATITYDEDLFRNVSVYPVGLTKCTSESNSAQCLLLRLSATPKSPLVDEIIVKTNVWDDRRNAKQNFFNNGIDFVGNTENPLPFFKVVDGRNGITTIYTTDFTLEDQEHAVDQYGNTWTLVNGNWQKDYVAPDMTCNVSSYIGYDRTCPEFAIMKEGQALLGTQYFDSSKIQSEVGDSFAHVYPEQTDRLAGTQLGD